MSDETFEGSDEAGATQEPNVTIPTPLPPPPVAMPLQRVPAGYDISAPQAPQAPQAPPLPPAGPGPFYAPGTLGGTPPLGGPPASPPPPMAPPNWAFRTDPPSSGGVPSGPAQPAHRQWGALIAVGAAVVTLAAGVGIGHAAWKSGSSTPLSNQSLGGTSGGGAASPNGIGGTGSGSSSSSGSSASSGPKDVSSIAKKVDPGLVDVNTTLAYQEEEAAGTGIVLTSNGEVLTNNHVIEGATTISVTDIGNGKTYSASVVGYDRAKDIAVLQLHNASGLQTANIGNSDKLAVGQDIVGIGNAGGTGGTPSAAGGTVTALNQSINASDEGDSSSEQLTGLVETNADIQAGDSGGPLVDASGQVLGMDTAASAGFSYQSTDQSSGVQGYSIPINEATSIAKEIEASDASSTVHIGSTAFLGVQVEPVSDSISNSPFGQGYGYGYGNNNSGSGSSSSSGSSSGAEIVVTVTSGPAQEAGLAPEDVITSVDGKTVTSPDDLTDLLAPYHPGDKVTIGYTDASGTTHTTTVTLSSGPPQ
jgi:S1-C subfamily serine protease